MIGGLDRKYRYLLASASVVGILAFGSPEAYAQQDLRGIQSQIDSLQTTIKELQRQVADAKAQAASAKSAAASASSGGGAPDVKVDWKGPAPTISSGDGKKFSFKLRGRVEADYQNINQDSRITTYPDVSATELRRARLGIQGTAFYDISYIFEADFANDSVAVRDAYLQYNGVKIGDNTLAFRAGNFRTPTSFELLTSELFVDTVERAGFIDAWQMQRQIGFQTMYFTDHWGVAAGIFGDRYPNADAPAPLFPGFTGEEDLTFAARGTIAPINRKVDGVNQVLHFGASVRTREQGDDQQLFSYSQRGADLHLANNSLNTQRIGHEDTFWGLEAATLWGPFSLQGEYSNLSVDLPTAALIPSNPPGAGEVTLNKNPFFGKPSPDYNAWYITGTWFFGGHKNYNKEGRWDRPTVDNPLRWSEHGGWGALELVGKYDVLDMSDSAFNKAGGCPSTRLYPNLPSASGSIAAPSLGLCGEQKTWIVGVNWYLNDYVRLMFDYSRSELSGYPLTAVGTGTSFKPGVYAGFDDATVQGFNMRAQVDW